MQRREKDERDGRESRETEGRKQEEIILHELDSIIESLAVLI